MDVFIGTISLFGFNFAPRGWAMCAGQLLPISQNSALFALLGTMYGGDGIQTFGLPDLRGRVAVGMGNGPGLSPYNQGQMAGSETVTLLQTEMPMHNHLLNVSGSGATSTTPSGNVLAVSALPDESPVNTYGPTPNATANPQAIGMAGGNQPHQNIQPYLALNYCIALEGIFPSRN
jgi:microcystin-dependent protein